MGRPDGGYDLESIAAVVLGGTALAGGRGGVLGTLAGVLILALLDNVFNLLQVNAFLKDVLRGVIIVAAVALYALARRRRRNDDGHGRRSAQDRAAAPRVAPARSCVARGRGGAVFVVLVVLLVWIADRRTRTSSNPPVFLAFLKRAAPLMILAAGQLFVIVSGEFDLSVGSLITVVVVAAARTDRRRPGMAWSVIAVLFALGAVVGLVNGVVTTRCACPRSSPRWACLKNRVCWQFHPGKRCLSPPYRRFFVYYPERRRRRESV